MKITLGERTAETVAIYFHKTNNERIRKVLPQKAQTVEEALADYERARLPGATSYGRTIFVEDRYVGDIWCYGIDPADTPGAMVSYCVFETECWGKGIATEATRMFLCEIATKYQLGTVGAFTFSNNTASVKVLEKNGFQCVEEFVENGVSSRYYQFEM